MDKVAALVGKRALVVEDEPLISLVIKDTLLALGFTTVIQTYNLETGLAIAQVGVFDFVTLTIRLSSKENSLPIAAELKKRNIPYLFITGYLEETAREIVPDTSEPIFYKPFTPEQLCAAIQVVLKL